MLARVVEIHDLNRARELTLGNVPDPNSPIGKDDPLFRSRPSSILGFVIQAAAEVCSAFDGSDIGCRTLIAQWPALFIGRGLREHAA
jgi:hypothetical protein